MLRYAVLLLTALSAVTPAPQRQRQQQQAYSTATATTPVPILRQINSHNDDGSFQYGYEAADGSYKVESRGADGAVRGKYGYYDDVGQLREIEYGATKNGFVPTGTGINVPPPTTNSISSGSSSYQGDGGDDDGQYRPSQYETPYEYVPEQAPQQVQFSQNNFDFGPQQQQPVRRPSNRARAYNSNNRQQQQQQTYYQPEQQQEQTYYQPEQQQPQPAYSNYSPQAAQIGPNTFQGHPATNINLSSGSYSINY